MVNFEKGLELLKKDAERFSDAAASQLQVWRGEKPLAQPLLLSAETSETADWPDYNTKETHYDSQKMFVSGLKSMLAAAAGGMQAVPSMRANMGCGIFASLFPGIRQELFDDKMPWVQKHLSKEAITELRTADLTIGDEFAAGLAHMEYMADQLRNTGCLVFPMDVQGPFDIAHLVYGDAIFYDLFDDPQFVHHLLELSCQAIFLGVAACLNVMPDSHRQIAHYNGLVMPRQMGGIKTSEDTSTLLSQEHIAEYVTPYLRKVLNHFGGGYVHYCGRNTHLMQAVINEPLVYGLNLGNPDMHDMIAVLKMCADNDKIYYGPVPKPDDEPIGQYFRKLVDAAAKNDRIHLDSFIFLS
jgi:hypothetical protein